MFDWVLKTPLQPQCDIQDNQKLDVNEKKLNNSFTA